MTSIMSASRLREQGKLRRGLSGDCCGLAELVENFEDLASQPSMMSLNDRVLETCFVIYKIRTLI